MQHARFAKTLIALATLASASATVHAIPEPPSGLTRDQWQVRFSFDDLARIEITLPGEAEPRTYWYLLFTCENRSTREIDSFSPYFELVTDKLIVLQSIDAPRPVFDAIRDKHTATYKYLTPVLPRKLRVGDDMAVDGVAIFEALPIDTASMRLFVHGLSNVAVTEPNPLARLDPEAPRSIQYFKTLEIHYQLPGDELTRQTATPLRLNTRWIMRPFDN